MVVRSVLPTICDKFQCKVTPSPKEIILENNCYYCSPVAGDSNDSLVTIGLSNRLL